MRKLIYKICIYAGFVCLLLVCLEYLSMAPQTKATIARVSNSEDYLSQGSGTSDIIPIIQSAKEEDDRNVLVIGDSIARQMFTSLLADEPQVKVACANAAINITGQYMIAMEYLESHPEAEEIWLFAHPLTLTRTYDLDLGYGYAVMPFAIEGSLKYLDDVTLDQMASVYGRLALNGKISSLVDASPLNRKMFLSYIRMHNTAYVQEGVYDIAAQYILRLKAECEARGVDFHFYSSPSTEYYRDKISETKEDYVNSPLYDVYPDYLDSVYYFPTEWSDDYTHFGEGYANVEVYRGVIEEAYGGDIKASIGDS